MPEDLSVQPDSRSDEDLDKLADSTDTARNTERPMTAVPDKPAPDAKEEFEFDYSGKKIKGTREQILKWAQMGYDRPQFMQKFNQEKAKWDSDKQGWEKNWGIYRQIDDFAKQNQPWWNHVLQSWQTRQGFQGGQPANQGQQPAPGQSAPGQAEDPRYSQLEDRFNQVLPLVEQWQQDRISQKQNAEDTALDQEIQTIRQSHGDFDWTSLDENGKSLEVRVLEHAQANGIPTFRAAFRDLLHDDLVTRAQSQAKLAVAKGIQTKTKLGVLGESPTPQKWSPRNAKPIRNTSYEELESEAREELRTGKA